MQPRPSASCSRLPTSLLFVPPLAVLLIFDGSGRKPERGICRTIQPNLAGLQVAVRQSTMEHIIISLRLLSLLSSKPDLQRQRRRQSERSGLLEVFSRGMPCHVDLEVLPRLLGFLLKCAGQTCGLHAAAAYRHLEASQLHASAPVRTALKERVS